MDGKNKFKFKYAPVVWVLLIVVLLLSAVGVGYNIYLATVNAGKNTINVVSYSVVAAVSLILFILSLSMLVYGKYVITEDCVCAYFGVVVSKIKISEITEFDHFRKSGKLVMYYGQKSFTVIVVSPEEYEQFILCVREHNKEIVYRDRIEGEDTPE